MSGQEQLSDEPVQRTHDIRLSDGGVIQVRLRLGGGEMASDHYATMGLFEATQ